MTAFYCIGGFYVFMDKGRNLTMIKFGAIDPQTNEKVVAAIGHMSIPDSVEMATMILKMHAGVPMDTPMQISFPSPSSDQTVPADAKKAPVMNRAERRRMNVKVAKP